MGRELAGKAPFSVGILQRSGPGSKEGTSGDASPHAMSSNSNSFFSLRLCVFARGMFLVPLCDLCGSARGMFLVPLYILCGSARDLSLSPSATSAALREECSCPKLSFEQGSGPTWENAVAHPYVHVDLRAIFDFAKP